MRRKQSLGHWGQSSKHEHIQNLVTSNTISEFIYKKQTKKSSFLEQLFGQFFRPLWCKHAAAGGFSLSDHWVFIGQPEWWHGVSFRCWFIMTFPVQTHPHRRMSVLTCSRTCLCYHEWWVIRVSVWASLEPLHIIFCFLMLCSGTFYPLLWGINCAVLRMRGKEKLPAWTDICVL